MTVTLWTEARLRQTARDLTERDQERVGKRERERDASPSSTNEPTQLTGGSDTTVTSTPNLPTSSTSAILDACDSGEDASYDEFPVGELIGIHIDVAVIACAAIVYFCSTTKETHATSNRHFFGGVA